MVSIQLSYTVKNRKVILYACISKPIQYLLVVVLVYTLRYKYSVMPHIETTFSFFINSNESSFHWFIHDSMTLA